VAGQQPPRAQPPGRLAHTQEPRLDADISAMTAPEAPNEGGLNRAAMLIVDGFVCWLVIPAASGLMLRPVFHYVGLDFVVVWAAVVAVTTLVYGHLRGHTAAKILLFTIGALLVLPLLIFIVVVVALSSCNCNPGG
jgi:hypothetical protein